MILENTHTNKIQYFAMYLGQDVEVTDSRREDDKPQVITLTPKSLMTIHNRYYSSAKLILKPLKDITDEHVKEFEGISGINLTGMLGDFSFCIYRHALPQTIDMIDFLRLRGYAIEYDAHKYVEYGWVKK